MVEGPSVAHPTVKSFPLSIRYELMQCCTKLFVMIKQNKGREQQAGEAYAKLLLTEQGQKAIEQAGFMGVR